MSTSEAVKTEKQCIESARRAMAWLLPQQGPNGAWKGLDTVRMNEYYKAGWALSLLGEAAAAERMLDYVKRHFLQPDGDFLPREGLWHEAVHYQYANGWFTIGAQKQGRYDISMPGIRFLLSQQDLDHGGFYAEKAGAGEKRRSDTMSSGIAGIACLATGQMDAAKKLTGYFERLIEMQPTPAERLYVTIEANGQLGTEFPDGEAFWRVIDTQQKDQCWYAVGLPFTFAVLMHQATGEERYAQLAEWLYDFQLRCVNPWDGGSSGKAAWGCSVLYRVTGEPRYRDAALRVARNYMACQTPEGWFNWDGQQTTGSHDGASEISVWLGLIGSNLLARDSA